MFSIDGSKYNGSITSEFLSNLAAKQIDIVLQNLSYFLCYAFD